VLARLFPGSFLACLAGDERGSAGERVAARAVTRRGWHILGRRIQTADGELDLVCLQDDVLVVIEVKTGNAGPRFRPGDRVTRRDLARRARAARRLAPQVGACSWRVDVVEVIVGRLGRPARVLHHADAGGQVARGRPPWRERLPWGFPSSDAPP